MPGGPWLLKDCEERIFDDALPREAISASEIIEAPEHVLTRLPEWILSAYDRGQLVISKTGVTVLTSSKKVRANAGDYIVFDQHGVFLVYDEATFQREFTPAQLAAHRGLHAA